MLIRYIPSLYGSSGRVTEMLVPQLNNDIDNVKKYAIMAGRSKALLHLDFDCISPQTLNRREEDFKYN